MTDATNVVTNGDFLRSLAGPLGEGEHFHIAGFLGSPATDPRWGGIRWKGKDECPTDPADNNYFSVAVLNGPERKRSNFVRMLALVADDPEVIPSGATWVLQTSEGKRQLGYALVDDEQSRDPVLCAAALKVMALRGMFKADKSGNNVVRYVRLPNGTNTKYDPPFPHVMEQWHPSRRFTLGEALSAFGIDIQALELPDETEAASAPLEGLDAATLMGTLMKIDPTCGYEDWTSVAMGVHHTTGGAPAGLRAFDYWSSTAGPAHYAGAQVIKAKWASMGDYDGAPVTWATVERLAREGRSAVGDLFEDLVVTHSATLDEPVAGFEPQEYTHEGVLPVGVTLFAGGHGHGKTSLLVPMACISSGELDGARTGLPADLHRHVFYFTEDPAQARRIRYGLQKHCGLVPKGNFHIHQATRIDAAALKARIAKIVEKYTVEGPNGYAVRPLIVFDTINACFEIENENDASQVGQIMSAIKTSSKGAPVWLVGHLPKSLLMKDVVELTARGSGAWEADAQCTAFIVAGEADSNVRYLVTKKRRFETTTTEVKFETFTDSETVQTPWGTTQVLGYRYGVPERPAVARKDEKAARQEDAKTRAFMQEVETVVEFIENRVEAEGEVWMRRNAPGVSPMPPEEAKGFVLNWDEIYNTTRVAKRRAPRELQDAVKERFEPFEGWGRMVLKEEGALW